MALIGRVPKFSYGTCARDTPECPCEWASVLAADGVRAYQIAKERGGSGNEVTMVKWKRCLERFVVISIEFDLL